MFTEPSVFPIDCCIGTSGGVNPLGGGRVRRGSGGAAAGRHQGEGGGSEERGEGRVRGWS